MKTLIASFVVLPFLAAGFPGCAATGNGADKNPAMEEAKAEEGAAKKEKEEKEDVEAKLKSLQRKLEIAQARYDHVVMEQAAQEKAAKEAIEYAQKELELSRSKLEQFEKIDAPLRLAREKLNLQRSKDMAAEAAEELKQLEIMYKDQDLEDMTAEFVINRGKRNAERQKQALEIQERAYLSLADHEIPREREALELEVKKKGDALEKAKTAARSGALQKRIAVLSAESEMADLKDQMAKLQNKLRKQGSSK